NHRVAIDPTSEALRGGRRELGSGMAPPLGEVAPREEPDRAQQRDRDRAAVMEHRILAKTIDPDRKPVRGAFHRDEIVQACLGRRWLDPPAPDLETVGPLEERDGGAGLAGWRTRGGIEWRR